MLTAKQLKIFGLFGRNTFKEYTFKELKESSRERSHSVLQNALKKFTEEGLVSVRHIGTSKLFKIDHENDRVHHYLGLYNADNLTKVVRGCIGLMKKELDKENLFYSLVIFGSYADGSASDKSDLDVAIFIRDKSEEKRILVAMNVASLKSLLELDYHIIVEADFFEMLQAEYENLGKQIVRKNLPVHNLPIFYKLMQMGVKHGFNPLS